MTQFRAASTPTTTPSPLPSPSAQLEALGPIPFVVSTDGQLLHAVYRARAAAVLACSQQPVTSAVCGALAAPTPHRGEFHPSNPAFRGGLSQYRCPDCIWLATAGSGR
jgi:hypothetical protein